MKMRFYSWMAIFLIFCSHFAYGQLNVDTNLYVIVATKIKLEELKLNINTKSHDDFLRKYGIIDSLGRGKDVQFDISHYRAKYKIIRNLYNKIETDTVEFVNTSWYGRPPFEKFDYVVLYLYKNKNGVFLSGHYMFDIAYKINHNWYGVMQLANKCKMWKNFNPIKFNANNKIKLNFEHISDDDTKLLSIIFPEPYFKVSGKIVYPKLAFEIKDIVYYRIIEFLKEK